LDNVEATEEGNACVRGILGTQPNLSLILFKVFLIF